MQQTRLSGSVVPALVAAAVACGGGEPMASTVRDSAGVVITETAAAALAAAPAWRLADPPLLEIGTVEGDPARQFAGIEAVLRLPDGRYVVADRGSAELRFFDSAGRHLASRGRPGEAPGEYRYLSSLGSGPGDSLWAFDFGLRRFTVLDAAGTTVRTVAVGPALSSVTAVGRLADGGFVLREQWGTAVHGAGRAGLARHPAAVARLAADGATLDTLALVPGREVYLRSEGGRAVMSAPLLARRAVAAMHDPLVFVGDQAAFEIRVYDPVGALRRVVRVTGLDLRATPDMIRRATEAQLATVPGAERAMQRAHLAAMATPETRPAYGPLVVDDGGRLWVGSYEVAGPSGSWTVFGADGSLLAKLATPPHLTVHQVSGDLVIGTWRDELDVEYVRVYWLERR